MNHDAHHGTGLEMRAQFEPVRSRHVFFFNGFDPKGASFCHALYRDQAALQGALTDVSYSVGPRQKLEGGNSLWHVEASTADGHVHTTVEYVRWDDIVRAHWPRNAWQVLTGAVLAYRSILASRKHVTQTWHLAPKTLVSLAYPAVFWTLIALLSAACGWLVRNRVAATLFEPTSGWVTAVTCNLSGFAMGSAIVIAAWQLEKRLHTTWLLRIFRFTGQWARQRVVGLDARLAQTAQAVSAKMNDPAIDEVLLVGFSVGAMLCVVATAQVLQRQPTCGGEQRKTSSKLSMLTLGQCLPLLAGQPQATHFRDALQQVGADARLCWVDVSSPTDWGSFALVDPVTMFADNPMQQAPNPRIMLSPRFHRLFTPVVYTELRKDKRRMHLQYLMAGELPGTYDYFAITAGSMGLRQRLVQEKIS